MKITNLTPHEITVGSRVLPASGQVARVAVQLSPAGEFDGIPLVEGTYGQATDLPEQQAGTLLIVSSMVRTVCLDRGDLASPADLVRDNDGKITGARALEVNPSL